MAVDDAHVFPCFLTPVLTQPFFPKPHTTFPTFFCRGERRKCAGKKVRLNRGSNSQPPGHESDTLATESPGRGSRKEKKKTNSNYSFEVRKKQVKKIIAKTEVFIRRNSSIAALFIEDDDLQGLTFFFFLSNVKLKSFDDESLLCVKKNSSFLTLYQTAKIQPCPN